MSALVARRQQAKPRGAVAEALELRPADQPGLSARHGSADPWFGSLPSHAFAGVTGGTLALERPRYGRAFPAHAAFRKAASEIAQLGVRPR